MTKTGGVSRLNIWINFDVTPAQREHLENAAAGHELRFHAGPGTADELAWADVAFGQPLVAGTISSPRLRWVQVSSAGFGRYDTAEVRRAFSRRGTVLTKSSAVYATPCAQHVLAFMLAGARRLGSSFDTQRGDRDWPSGRVRAECMLLEDQKVVLVGFGSIGARLVELLAPLTTNVVGVRQRIRGDEPIEMLNADDPRVELELGRADHVVNLLPGTPSTRHFFDARRLAWIRPGAVFYNVGRGTTVDQAALTTRLKDGTLASAFLDVTDPEPLPPEHELWSEPRCVITPHAAGGHRSEGARLVRHFTENLKRFVGGIPLRDRAF